MISPVRLVLGNNSILYNYIGLSMIHAIRFLIYSYRARKLWDIQHAENNSFKKYL